MNRVRLRAAISAALLAAGLAGFVGAAAATSSEVVIVPISGTVDDGMAHLVERSVTQANRDGARALVLDIDSGGGLVSSAFDISDAIKTAKMPVIAYVSERAYSAAALIALNAGRIVMGPGASIGAAEPIPYSDKMVSALRGEFESTAQRTHHDPQLAGAMVDKDMTAPYKSTGKVLTLNSDDAVRAHLAASSAATLDGALAQSGLQNATQVRTSLTFGETLARFATDPIVSGLLLTLGMLGLLIEMQTLHGIAGTIGVLAFVLFFGTHVYAGFSNGLIIALAVFGVAGILFELHVLPGHGIPGIVGALALVSAIVLSFGAMYFFIALETLASAIVLTVIVYSLLAKTMPENAWIRRLTLAAEQGPEYVTSADFTYLRGQSGTATSFLRPAGVAAIGGHRVDVLTEGDFISAGSPIRVTRVEGARIFVEPDKHGQGSALATRG